MRDSEYIFSGQQAEALRLLVNGKYVKQGDEWLVSFEIGYPDDRRDDQDVDLTFEDLSAVAKEYCYSEDVGGVKSQEGEVIVDFIRSEMEGDQDGRYYKVVAQVFIELN